jgi:hypothetical protein
MFACNCMFDDNRDCDDISGVPVPYRCYVEFGWYGLPFPPVCGPACYQFDPPDEACQIISMGFLRFCDMGSGQCMP